MSKGGGDNNQQKAKPGMNVTLGLDAESVTDDSKLSGMAVMAVGALAFLAAARYLRKPVQRAFGIKSSAAAADTKPLSVAEPHEIIERLKSIAVDKPSSKAFVAKEMVGAMSPGERENFEKFMQRSNGGGKE